MVDRSEISGFVLAAAGHGGLLALLLWTVPKTEVIRPPMPPAIEVSITDETALEASIPDPGTDAAAARLSPVEAPLEPDLADPAPTPPDTATRPAQSQPAPDGRDRRRPDRTQPAQPNTSSNRGNVKPTGSLEGLDMSANGERPNDSTSRNPPAVPGPVRTALLAELRRMMFRNWVPPTGADSSKLRTWVHVSLRPDGSVADVRFLRQEGRTDLNIPQQELHKERAIAAVRKTRFDTSILKPEYYSVWGSFDTYFDKRP